MRSVKSDTIPDEAIRAILDAATRALACCFFFSSRRRHTRFDCDWSSDVCSSNLAVDLSPEQLGLIKLWIDQGAKGEVHAAASVEWRPLPDGVNPIYAVALTRDEIGRASCRERV